MKYGKFDIGTIIKGKNLKKYTLCKILYEDMCMRDFQYKIGLNEDIQPLVRKGTCQAGLHFSLINNILEYLDYGTKLAFVSVPDDEDVYVDEYKFRTHKLSIDKILSLGELSTWEYLYKNNVNIIKERYAGMTYTAKNGFFNILKYLHENGAEVDSNDNDPIKMASEEGHFEIVKYLYENGADITAGDNYAIKNSVKSGNIDVVKFLVEHGANIFVRNNYPIRYAARYGYLDIVKYLHEQGGDITDSDNFAMKKAIEYGHLDIIKYLHDNGIAIK